MAARTALVAGLLLAFPAVAPAATASRIASGIPALVAERPEPAHVRIARDPETGGWTLAPLSEVRTSATIAAEAEAALNHSHAGLFEVPLPGGGWAMDLQGRFQTFSIARRDARGGTDLGCEHDALSLFHWLTEVPPAVDAHGRPLR